MMRIIFFLILVSVFFHSNGQSLEKILAYEEKLMQLMRDIRNAETLKDKLEKNELFAENLKKMLRYSESFSHSFDSLSTIMSTIISPDKEFRLFNWNVEVPKTEEQQYFCLIMRYDNKKKDYYWIELTDKSKYEFRDVELKAYTENKWYGALYYNVIPLKKGSGTIYTLLGWDGHDKTSTKKIIETMAFSGKSKVKFGHPIFKYDEKKTKRRIILQYKEQALVSLKYQEKKKEQLIIFDHLSPSSPQLEGVYSEYVPDGSYDAFKWENGKWVYIADVDARTGKSRSDKYYNDPDPNPHPNQPNR